MPRHAAPRGPPWRSPRSCWCCSRCGWCPWDWVPGGTLDPASAARRLQHRAARPRREPRRGPPAARLVVVRRLAWSSRWCSASPGSARAWSAGSAAAAGGSPCRWAALALLLVGRLVTLPFAVAGLRAATSATASPSRAGRAGARTRRSRCWSPGCSTALLLLVVVGARPPLARAAGSPGPAGSPRCSWSPARSCTRWSSSRCSTTSRR